MSFKNKKGSESEIKTFVCPHGYFRNYSSNFGKKNSDIQPRRKYFISYSPHIYHNALTKCVHCLTLKSKNIKRFSKNGSSYEKLCWSTLHNAGR